MFRRFNNNNKYNAKKTIVDGITFDSKFEADEYKRLKVLEKAGVISNLELQPEFTLLPTLYKDVVVHLKTKDKIVKRVDEREMKYHADFKYEENGKVVVLECKSKGSLLARDYSLRRKLVKWHLRHLNEELGEEKYIFKEIIQKLTRWR